MYKYVLTIYTQHNKTLQALFTSDDLLHLIETADRIRHNLYKDQKVIVKESKTNNTVYEAERW